MPFIYTDDSVTRNPVRMLDADVESIMRAHLDYGVRWTGGAQDMRQRFGIPVRTMQAVRRSQEFRLEVARVAERNGWDAESMVAQFCLGERQTRQRRSRAGSGRMPTSPAPAPAEAPTPAPPPVEEFAPSQNVVAGFPTRQFGIELEVASKLTRRQLYRVLSDADVPVYVGYYDEFRPNAWKLGTDNSIRASERQRAAGYTETMEIVAPPLSGAEGLAQVERVTRLIRQYVTANRTCGMHCHVDLAGVTADELRRLSAAWMKYEWVINTLIPESRRYRNNHYCYDNGVELHRYEGESFGSVMRDQIRRVTSRRLVRTIRSEMENNCRKYRKFNLSAMTRHGTVEFRYAAGTGDPVKILKQIQFCVAFVEEFMHGDLVEAVETRPSLWDATTELVTRLWRTARTIDFPSWWMERQVDVGGAVAVS